MINPSKIARLVQMLGYLGIRLPYFNSTFSLTPKNLSYTSPKRQLNYMLPKPPTNLPSPIPAPVPSPTLGVGNKQETFVQSLLPFAQQFQSSTGIPAAYALAMAANETGWEAKNPVLFGIKGTSPSGNSGKFRTWEDYGQGRTNIIDQFATYTDPREAFSHLAFEMQTPRYRGAPLTSAFDFAQFIKNRGWATDPAYANKIAALASQIRNFANL